MSLTQLSDSVRQLYLLLSGLLTPQNAFTILHFRSFTNMHPHTVGKDYEIIYSDTDTMSLMKENENGIVPVISQGFIHNVR